MYKPRNIAIAVLVIAAYLSLSTLGRAGHSRTLNASAFGGAPQYTDPTPTPTPSYTPEAFIPVEMYALTNWGASRDVMCGEEGNELLYGCTAFCNDSEFDQYCNKTHRLPFPYSDQGPIPSVGVENDYVLDVLSQEMGPAYENVTLRAGAIAIRSFALQQREALGGTGFTNSFLHQVFIPYRFNTYNPDYPGSTCGLPEPLINRDQQKICDAVSPRYYLSPDYNDYPARANHFSDIQFRTRDVSFDKPYLVGVEDPISGDVFPCEAVTPEPGVIDFGMSQKGANRWARGNRCAIGEGIPWSVAWTHSEQILFHYFTRVHLRDADKDKKIISPDWRWNPLKIEWETQHEINGPPVMVAGQTHVVPIQIQNTSIADWACRVSDSHPDTPLGYRLRYRWLNGSTVIYTSTGLPLCNVPAGSARNELLQVYAPPGLSGLYTLRLDMYETLEDFWFSDGGWPPYDVTVRLMAPTPTPTATRCNDC